jgi:hypothetical protein
MHLYSNADWFNTHKRIDTAEVCSEPHTEVWEDHVAQRVQLLHRENLTPSFTLKLLESSSCEHTELYRVVQHAAKQTVRLITRPRQSQGEQELV